MKYLLIFEKFESAILYHGSDVDFEEFDEEKVSSGDSSELFGKGFYLTNNYEIAKHYAILKVKSKHIERWNEYAPGGPKAIYKIDADEIANREFKVNKFQINGNILDIETFKLDEEFLNEIRRILIKRDFDKDWVERIIYNATKNITIIKNFEGELKYIVDLLFTQKSDTEKLANYIKSLGYDGIKFRSRKNFERHEGLNYCIYNKNIIKKII